MTVSSPVFSRRPTPPTREVMTAGQAAKILKVAPRTIAMMFQRGQLQGYRIPSAKGPDGDRRLVAAAVMSLARRLGRLGQPFDGSAALIVGSPRWSRAVKDAIANAGLKPVAVNTHGELFAAGSMSFAVVIIDLSSWGRNDGLSLARQIRKQYDTAIMVGLYGDDEPEAAALASEFTAAAASSDFGPEKLAGLVAELLDPSQQSDASAASPPAPAGRGRDRGRGE